MAQDLADGAVVTVLLAFALVGAVMPQEIPDTLMARQFVAVQADGTHRALMNFGGFYFDDLNGQPIIALNGTGLTYYQEGQPRMQLGLHIGESRSGLFLYDAEGNVIWEAPR